MNTETTCKSAGETEDHFHDTRLLLRQYRQISYAVKLSEKDLGDRTEKEHRIRMSVLEINAALAGIDLSGSKLESYTKSICRSRSMLRIIENALEEYMYQKVCFCIDSMYKRGKGFPDRTARIAFQEEAKRLFRCAGWEIIPGPGCEGDYAVKGKQSLFLHPTEFSGVILAEEVGRVRNALRAAKSFHLRSIGRSA